MTFRIANPLLAISLMLNVGLGIALYGARHGTSIPPTVPIILSSPSAPAIHVNVPIPRAKPFVCSHRDWEAGECEPDTEGPYKAGDRKVTQVDHRIAVSPLVRSQEPVKVHRKLSRAHSRVHHYRQPDRVISCVEVPPQATQYPWPQVRRYMRDNGATPAQIRQVQHCIGGGTNASGSQRSLDGKGVRQQPRSVQGQSTEGWHEYGSVRSQGEFGPPGFYQNQASGQSG